jgi:hypothetical protein
MWRPASSTSRACRPEADISIFTRTLLAAYFIEAGLILIVAPWSGFWARNVFAEYLPALQPVLASPFFRGAVSGIGVVTVVAGVAELAGLLLRRRPAAEAPAPRPGEPTS